MQMVAAIVFCLLGGCCTIDGWNVGGMGRLTTWRKKSKSSELFDAAGVVDLLRPVVVLPRRVVVAGTFCNKSSISLILIGKPVVVEVVVVVATVDLILSPAFGARAFAWLFPRLKTRVWWKQTKKIERNSSEHTLSHQMEFLSLSYANLIKFYCAESDSLLEFPSQNILTALNASFLFVNRNLRHSFRICFCCGAWTGWTLCRSGHRFNRFFHIMCILEIMVWRLVWTDRCHFDRLRIKRKHIQMKWRISKANFYAK